MPKSQKPIIIEHLFFDRYEPSDGTLSDPIVTSGQLARAKQYCMDHKGTTLHPDKNNFNFMKDIVRGKTASKIWPDSIRKLGFLGRQKTGAGAVLEFYRFTESEESDLEEHIRPTEATPCIPIQSVSMPLASRDLGRVDESWLLQVCVNLRIIETHLAIGPNRQVNIIEVTHLQMDLKLYRVQIDALFLASFETTESERKTAIITLEAKQDGQRILKEQLARQVRAAFSATDAELVIPLAVSAIRDQGVHVVEFKSVPKSGLSDFSLPEFHRDALFVLEPPVEGITKITRRKSPTAGKKVKNKTQTQ